MPARTRPPATTCTARQRPPPPPRPHRVTVDPPPPSTAITAPLIKEETNKNVIPPPAYSELYPPMTSQTILRRYSHGQVPPDNRDEIHKLPPPRPNPPNRKFSEGNLPADINYKFNHKRNATIILPPPIQTDFHAEEPVSNLTESDKISERQDSNVSSDSFSQTSSPSYTTKSMEAPLLPGITIKGGGRKKKYHSERIKDVGPIKFERDQSVVAEALEDPNTSPITKSHSTPASLQTIVRFHNGSNMSLHHRVSFEILFY